VRLVVNLAILSVTSCATISPAQAEEAWLLEDVKATCAFTIEGHEYLNAACRRQSFADGSISLSKVGGQGYFVQLDTPQDSKRAAFWSGPDVRATHAHSFLGYLVKNGNCWENRKARICVSELSE
jgi:hypothetical protein